MKMISGFLMAAIALTCVASPLRAAPAKTAVDEGTQISGTITPQTLRTPIPGLPVVGLLADSQFQTTKANGATTVYKGPWQDRLIGVTLRPPALDWAARYLAIHYLEQLKASGATVIFYLGDGANNGCEDEFLGGYEEGAVTGEYGPGILKTLADFRTRHQIPVYYILGNHDFLGAGNTSLPRDRKRLCTDDSAKQEKASRPNPIVTKYRAMRAADRFNRENAAIAPDLAAGYVSNFGDDPEKIRVACEGATGSLDAQQHRHFGCYLAATLTYTGPARRLQFLLLDSIDLAQVTNPKLGNYEFVGLRGALSWKGAGSQTDWFETHAREPVDLRIALSHYPLAALGEPAGLSRKRQRTMALFADLDLPRQKDGYFISGHTHTEHNKLDKMTINTLCRRRSCDRPATIRELNIGSTTDYATSATIARFTQGRDGRTDLEYLELRKPRGTCAAVFDDMAEGRYGGASWEKFGLDPYDPRSYQPMSAGKRGDIYRRLAAALGPDLGTPQAIERASCIALWASEIEGEQ